MRLRPLPFLALPLLALSAPAWAGASHVGLRAGLNVSRITSDFAAFAEPDPRLTPNVGLVYEYDFAPQLSFHGEVGYSGKGGVSHFSGGTDPFGNPTPESDDPWQFEYLEIPLLARGRFPPVGRATPFLEIGPTFDIRLSGHLQSDVVGDVNLSDRMQPVDFGFGLGTGVTFAAGPGRLGVEARYTHGLRDLFDAEDVPTAINEAWTFALSYTR